MNESIDDLTVQYEENGQVLINELDKVVLSKGAWTTILFRYQQWRPETDDYGPDKYVIRRYKKSAANTASSPNSPFPAPSRPARSWTPCCPGSKNKLFPLSSVGLRDGPPGRGESDPLQERPFSRFGEGALRRLPWYIPSGGRGEARSRRPFLPVHSSPWPARRAGRPARAVRDDC